MQFIHEKNRIYVENEAGEVIVLATFPFIAENVINVDHTFVTPELRGQGIASKLMKEVYDHAVKNNYTVVNTCPYAVAWFKRKKEYQHILNADINVDPQCKI